jgi:hypothetical protein
VIRNAQLWLPGLIKARNNRPAPGNGPVRINFCMVDHYEPAWRTADWALQEQRVAAWKEKYPRIASRHQDSTGRPPQHTFYYPEEQYHPSHLDALAQLRDQGFGDVEIHLHHDDDSPCALKEKLLRFVDVLNDRHGLLRKGKDGRLTYSFIHGNCALNNSRPDGKCCGVNDETTVLLDTGCYADLTMPCAPDPTQTRTVNSIYYAMPSPEPRGHDIGVEARKGQPTEEGLMMIQGPLGLNWRRRKWGLLPRLDNADISWHDPPTPERVRLWLDQHIHVVGAPDEIFVKISTHGCQDKNIQFLLNDGFEQLWEALETACRRDRGRYKLYYLTAWEVYNRIKLIEQSDAITNSKSFPTAI